MTKTIFSLRKMKGHLEEDASVSYYLRMQPKEDEGADLTSSKFLKLNDFIGKDFALEFQGEIACIECGRAMKKSFNQGYCYPCFQTLAECDMCIMKPELCHYDEGTCRSEEFAEQHCEIEHSIYLSLTSGLKVGITRGYQEVSRWIDQGAVRAIRIASVKRRKDAGLVEVQLAKHVADKTNWRKMLKNEYEDCDLVALREEFQARIDDVLEEHAEGFDEDGYLVRGLRKATSDAVEIKYPVLEYPQKVKSFNFDKDPKVEGTLMGIKGQYLILDTGVINLRKFAGYSCSL